MRFRRGNPRPINVVRSAGKSYQAVQDEIVSAVSPYLADGVTQTTTTYAPGSLNFTMFLRQPADVVMSHGVACKRYLWLRDDDTGERMLNHFAAVLVPGRWHRDRLLATSDITLRPDQVHIVGWPRLDLLLSAQAAFDRQDEAAGRRLRVLWAPTHDWRKRGPEQRSTSSYPEFEQHLAELGAHFDVEVSVHPRNRQDKSTTSQQLIWADAVISDFGTMVYEAWALGKPVLFPRWILEDRVITYLPNAAEAQIFADNVGLHPSSIGEMIDMLGDRAAIGDDVATFLSEYLAPESRGCAGRLVANVLERMRRTDVQRRPEQPSWRQRLVGPFKSHEPSGR